MFVARRALPRVVRGVRISAKRHNASLAPSSSMGSSSAVPKGDSPAQSPSEHLFTVRELDRLVTSIARSSPKKTAHPSPLEIRTNYLPWLSTKDPAYHARPDPSAEELQKMLEPKHMSESYTTFHLPLASDPMLLEEYVNATGGFRVGKLFELLDALAGAVGYRHCLPTPHRPLLNNPATQTQAFHEASSRAGLYLATASADRLDMFGRLNKDNLRDLRFSGFVTWTGNSSMEVAVKMEGNAPHAYGATPRSDGLRDHDGDGWETLMLGRFVMVCRDSKTHKARKVPPLVVESPEEQELWDMGVDYQRRRKESSKMALDKVPPTQQEVKELHELMLNVVDRKVSEVEGEKVVPMRDTGMESVQLMFPQQRNLHGAVFGGILMRLAHELCFTNAAVFASRPMKFLSLDQITFRLPVPIGAVLHLTSKVVKTTLPREEPDGEAKAHIMVRAEVEDVETGSRRETNTFFFTMAMEDDSPIGKTVVPETYSEAMQYLEGKRRLEVGDEMRRLYQAYAS